MVNLLTASSNKWFLTSWISKWNAENAFLIWGYLPSRRRFFGRGEVLEVYISISKKVWKLAQSRNEKTSAAWYITLAAHLPVQFHCYTWHVTLECIARHGDNYTTQLASWWRRWQGCPNDLAALAVFVYYAEVCSCLCKADAGPNRAESSDLSQLLQSPWAF